MTPIDEPRKAYPRGTYSKVARKLGITPQTVRLVALEKVTSRRVSAALREELRKAARREARQAARTASAA